MEQFVEFDGGPALERPTVVAAFRGWNDAGESASSAAEYLKERWSAARIGRLDPETFFDFQVARPTVHLADGVSRVIEWPANEFFHARVNSHDVVLFIGIEPNVRWRTFAGAIVDAAKSLGAERLVTLGAFLADVPYRRPVPVVGSAPTAEEAERLGLARSRYEGPTGIVGVLHHASTQAGLPSTSFWAAVPHYVPTGVNPKAALALVERLTAFLDLPVDAEPLYPAVRSWEERISELISENESLAEYVRRLEEAGADEQAMGPLPTGDTLAAEVERFLREQDGRPGD